MPIAAGGGVTAVRSLKRGGSVCDADGTVAAAAAAAVASVAAEDSASAAPSDGAGGVGTTAGAGAGAGAAAGGTAVPVPASRDPADVGIVKYLQIDTKLTPAKVLALKWRDAEVWFVIRTCRPAL